MKTNVIVENIETLENGDLLVYDKNKGAFLPIKKELVHLEIERKINILEKKINALDLRITNNRKSVVEISKILKEK